MRRGRRSIVGNPALLNTFRQPERRTSSFGLYWAVYRRHFRMPFALSALAVLINIPAFFEIVIIACRRPLQGDVFHELRITELRRNRYYKIWYRVACRMVFNTFGPNVVILCMFASRLI